MTELLGVLVWTAKLALLALGATVVLAILVVIGAYVLAFVYGDELFDEDDDR